MKKWIPFFVSACLALLSSIATLVIGVMAYLALTGLDLLVTATKTAPKFAVSLAILSSVLWIITMIIFIVTKPYKKMK